jgi:nitrite reductase/ring-hydroxylating ferredoxin subunit
VNEGDRLVETPPGITLGPLDLIADGKARNFVIQMKAGRFHGFIVRKGDKVFGYRDRCPHMGLPLAQELDNYLSSGDELILCSWHGALFDIESGHCLGGPCAGTGLTPWPVTVTDKMVKTA